MNVRRVEGKSERFDNVVVIGVSADPEPDGVIAVGQRQRAVVETDANEISPANALKMQRWMPQIGFQELKVLVGDRSGRLR
jgi:hypothetical protein